MKLTIIRGLPGSGKSTLARKMAKESGNIILLEPDALLMEDGVYNYTPERFQEAVSRLQSVIEILTNNECMDEDGSNFVAPEIIYCDVLPTARDVQKIINCMFFPSRDVIEVITLKISKKESMKRNCHNVRECDIDRMARDFEQVEVTEYGTVVKKESRGKHHGR
jgi:hypothetical protein